MELRTQNFRYFFQVDAFSRIDGPFGVPGRGQIGTCGHLSVPLDFDVGRLRAFDQSVGSALCTLIL